MADMREIKNTNKTASQGNLTRAQAHNHSLNLRNTLPLRSKILHVHKSLQNQKLFDISILLKFHEHSQQDCAKTDSECDLIKYSFS